MSIGLLIDVGKSLTLIESDLISVDLDVTLDEAHEWLSDVVTNPVEIGSPITDHIQQQPDKLTITGFISDSPITDSIASQLSTIGDSEFGTRAQTAFDLLRALMASKKLVTVYTRYRIYTDMALASINIPRSAGLGEAIQFTAQFTHVRMVETKTIDVPSGVSRNKEAKADGATKRKTDQTAKAGQTAPKPATPAAEKAVGTSVAKTLTSKLQ